jgi:hypothetical protein
MMPSGAPSAANLCYTLSASTAENPMADVAAKLAELVAFSEEALQ